MTTEEWRAAVAAARPQLSQAQLAALRPACQRMAEHMRNNAAPARKTEAAPAKPVRKHLTQGALSARS